MTTQSNPFMASETRAPDIFPGTGEFIPDGQVVPAGRGLNWISRGWEMFRAAPGAWIGLSVVFLAIVFVLAMIPVVNVLLNLVLPIFVGGIMVGCKAQEEGGELRVGHLFAAFQGYAGKLALVGVMYVVGIIVIALAVAVVGGGIGFGSAMMGGGSPSPAAFLVPALIAVLFFVPLAMAVWYAPALVIFHAVAPVQAMKSSFFACLKNFMPFLVYSLVLMVLAIAASLPLGLGWLVLVPVSQASIYASYRDMFTRS